VIYFQRLNICKFSNGIVFGTLCAFLIFITLSQAIAAEGTVSASDSDVDVMGTFVQQEIVEGEAILISDNEKYLIMFFMGITLLIFILTTAFLGISMVIYGKQVFVMHMVFAGLSVTLAIAHAVVAIVWFFPF